MIEPQTLADRYVAVWNETDAQARRQMIASLWVEDGQHYVRTLEVRGHSALETRILGSHNKNVRDAGNVFSAAANAEALPGVVKFDWNMLDASGVRVGGGREFLVLADDGRIATDYQFV